MTQTTQTKAAPVKTRGASKGAARKTQGQQSAAVKATTGIDAIKFFLSESRPGSGNFLASYTQAWLTVSGLADGGFVTRKIAESLAGKTMIKYHLGLGNLAETEKGISLTAQGKNAFFVGTPRRNIHAIPEAVEAYKAIFTDGTVPDAKIGLRITKSNIAVYKIAE